MLLTFIFMCIQPNTKRAHSSALTRLIALILLVSNCSGLAYADESTLSQTVPTDATDSITLFSTEPKSDSVVSHKIVAPNINLKEVAPPPEALLDSSSSPQAIKDEHSIIEDNTPSIKESPVTIIENIFDQPNETSSSQTLIPEAPSNEGIGERFYKPAEIIPDEKALPTLMTPESFVILGAEVPPGTSTRLGWTPGVAIAGIATPVPVLVINGEQPGKTFCLLAAIHGDELNGIEVVRRVIYEIDPKKLKGRIIGVPIVNLQGFQTNSRYLADRRDLNRYFPGTQQGSLASRIAYSLFNEVITHCDALIDLHTGSLRRTNLPQLRADMKDPKVIEFTEFFDDIVVVHSQGSKGMLRWAAAKQNIPAVTLEIGESNRLQKSQVDIGVKSINSLLDRLGMYERLFTWGKPQPVYYQTTWLRAEKGGILFSVAKLGNKVSKGEILGNVTDPITNAVSSIKAPYDGRIIGMAVNQVVMPGFAAYHLGIETSEKEVSIIAHQQEEDEEDFDIDSDVDVPNPE